MAIDGMAALRPLFPKTMLDRERKVLRENRRREKAALACTAQTGSKLRLDDNSI